MPLREASLSPEGYARPIDPRIASVNGLNARSSAATDAAEGNALSEAVVDERGGQWNGLRGSSFMSEVEVGIASAKTSNSTTHNDHERAIQCETNENKPFFSSHRTAPPQASPGIRAHEIKDRSFSTIKNNNLQFLTTPVSSFTAPFFRSSSRSSSRNREMGQPCYPSRQGKEPHFGGGRAQQPSLPDGASQAHLYDDARLRKARLTPRQDDAYIPATFTSAYSRATFSSAASCVAAGKTELNKRKQT